MAARKKKATRRPPAKRVPAKAEVLAFPTPEALEVEDTELQTITAHYSKIYGEEVVQDRAVPDFRDGLKPVHRASIWAAHKIGAHHTNKYVKSARIVGDVIGKYHPHGDTACYGAIVTIANSVMPNLIQGQGNWGSHVDNAAAHRYTEARLSQFSDLFLLDRDYLAVVPMIENYDGTQKWPLFLPATLPVQLLVGSPTVPAYGVSAGTPSFKLPGVAKLVELALKGKKITPRLCLKYLETHNRYGGECVSEEADLLEFYKTGKGSFRYVPDMEYDDNKEVFITSCCPGGFSSEKSINNSLEKIAALPGVSGVDDKGGRGQGRFNIRYGVKLKRQNENDLETTFDKIENIVSGSQAFHIGYTHRKRDGIKFGRMSVCTFIEHWTKYRVSLEVAVIKYLIKEELKKLARQELLLWGVDHIDDIASALKAKEGPHLHLKKLWPSKSEEFIHDILQLKVYQLAKLERGDILKRIKEIKTIIAALKKDLKAPAERILRDFNTKISKYMKTTKDRWEVPHAD